MVREPVSKPSAGQVVADEIAVLPDGNQSPVKAERIHRKPRFIGPKPR